MPLILALVLAVQDPYPEVLEPMPSGDGCGTCFENIALRNMTIEARSLAKSGRHSEALAKFCEVIRMREASSSHVVVVGAVNAAMATGQLKPFIHSLPGRSQVAGDVLLHLRALRARGKEDLFGLLALISEGCRADRLGPYRDQYESRPGRLDLLLEMIDLAASLGPSILGPLERIVIVDPAMKAWALFIIAGTRTDRARAIIEANPSDLNHRFLKILRSPPRPRSFKLEALSERKTMRAIEIAIRDATLRMGQTPPNFEEQEGWVPLAMTGVWAVCGIAALLILSRRLRVAGPLADG